MSAQLSAYEAQQRQVWFELMLSNARRHWVRGSKRTWRGRRRKVG